MMSAELIKAPHTSHNVATVMANFTSYLTTILGTKQTDWNDVHSWTVTIYEFRLHVCVCACVLVVCVCMYVCVCVCVRCWSSINTLH